MSNAPDPIDLAAAAIAAAATVRLAGLIATELRRLRIDPAAALRRNHDPTGTERQRRKRERDRKLLNRKRER